MSYFDLHPIIEYQYSIDFSKIKLIDLFRKNYIEVDDVFKKNYIMGETDTVEEIAYAQYENPKYFWLLFLSNNIFYRYDIPESLSAKESRIIKQFQRKKSYFISNQLPIATGNLLIKKEDFESFSVTADVHCFVSDYDAVFRKITVIENEKGLTFLEGNNILVLRQNNNTYEIVNPTGTTIERIDNFVDTPLSFMKNNIWINPYLNVSGSGVTYFKNDVSGVSFEKTLLYSYITNGISHSSYEIKNLLTNIKQDDNVILKIPDPNIIGNIENSLSEAFSISNSSRTWTLNVIRERIDIVL